MISLRERIKSYFKRHPDEWINKGIVSDLARNVGYSSENCGRRLRELKEEGVLEVKYKNGKNFQELAWYKLKLHDN